jgi:hypothetical protein
VATEKRLGMLSVINSGQQNEFVKTTEFNAPYFNVPVFHLTQMHLIRAESYALLNNNIPTAIDDINAIIKRAYSDNTHQISSGISTSALIDAIRNERRIELLFQGDRIMELKRLGAIEKQNIFIHGHPWNCQGLIMQFPITEQTSIFKINPTGGCN